jgi:deoxyribonuclease-4
MVKAADRAVNIGATALQIFSDNPTAWERRAEPSGEIAPFRQTLEQHDIVPLAIHGAYLINLAGGDDTFHAGSIRLLAAELDVARLLGARLINIHAGSHRGFGLEAGIERIVDGIARALATEAEGADAEGADARAGHDRPVITLENSAGGGGGLWVDTADLRAIADALDRAGIPRQRVAFCLDVAHLWGAGVDLSQPDGVDRAVRELADLVGADRLPLIHLNDTKAERGSRLDRHEHLGAGRIGAEGIAAILRHPLLAGASYVLETPGMEDGYDAINLQRAVALARGEPLAPLPPEAFALAARRSRAAPRRRTRDADDVSDPSNPRTDTEPVPGSARSSEPT